MRGRLKTGLFLFLLAVGINGLATGNVKGEEETTTAEFDYSKMPKQYRYDVNDYYNIGEASRIEFKTQKLNKAKCTPTPSVIYVARADGSGRLDNTLAKKYYKISYKNNDRPGKATAIIEGINGFYGKKEVKFKIVMAKPKIHQISRKGKRIKVKTTKYKIPGVKYEIRYKKHTKKARYFKRLGKYTEYYTNREIEGDYSTIGKWKYSKSKTRTIKTKNLKKGNYFVQVRTIITVNGKDYKSSWTAYNALFNFKTKSPNKKNYKVNHHGKFISPNYFNKYRKKYGWAWDSNNTTYNGVKTVTWSLYKTRAKQYAADPFYNVSCDRFGNLIVKWTK